MALLAQHLFTPHVIHNEGLLVRGDALDVLRSLPDACVDLILTDPAYESLEKHRRWGTTTRLKLSKGSSNPWFPIFPNARLPELLRELYRVLRQNRHAYILCDEETCSLLKPLAEEAGFKIWKSLIWVKTRKHMPKKVGASSPSDLAEEMVVAGMGYHWRNASERILFLEKGRRPLLEKGWSDVLFAPRVHRGYPTEKPVALLRRLIINSSLPGECVLDPFCGSGSTGVAARGLDRSYFLVDLQPQEAQKRLEQKS